MWWADINLWEVSFDGKNNVIKHSNDGNLSKYTETYRVCLKKFTLDNEWST